MLVDSIEKYVWSRLRNKGRGVGGGGGRVKPALWKKYRAWENSKS